MRFRLFLAVAGLIGLSGIADGDSRISDASVWNARGIRRFQEGDFRTALTCFETASRLRPGEGTIRFNLASAHARLALQLARSPMTRGTYATAVAEAERAIDLEPDHAFFHSVLGFVHQQMGKHGEAYREFRQAAALDPGDSGARVLLGNAAYDLDSLGGAIQEWRSALDLDPELGEVRERIVKADREKGMEKDFDVLEGGAFRIRYDPDQPDADALAREMLDVLEGVRREIDAILPRRGLGPVPVVVYPREEFHRLADGRAWTEGLYDGKIRFPFPAKGETSETFRALAAHEYTHAVLYEWTNGHCPAWLNEGLAQALAGEWNGAMEETARRMARDSSFVPLADLEESFLGLPDSLVDGAYVESYLVGRHILDTYEKGRIRVVLKEIGAGVSVESALRGRFGVDREELLADALEPVEREIPRGRRR